MKKKLLLYPIALLFFVPLLIPTRSELVIFPGKKNYKVHSFNDIADSAGNSLHCLSMDTGKAIVFDYTLRKNPKTEKSPYAGIVITLTDKDSFVDISAYDSMCVDIITKTAMSFKIYLKTFIDGYTILGSQDNSTFHYEQCEVLVHLGEIHYSKSIASDFHIPDFFIPHMKGLPLSPNNAKLFSIDFQSGSRDLENVPAQFKILKISFIKEHGKSPIAGICFGCFGIYVVLVSVLSFTRKKKHQPNQNPTPIQNPSAQVLPTPPLPALEPIIDEEARRLEEFINAHYQEPELTVEQVGHGAGITPVRVTGILQQKVNMTFKQYLNEIRITAAKQLLVKSDRSITEIAFAVGYNNIPHFNRVFKENAGKSPGEYRDGLKEPNNGAKS
jgi:AraC-like DNA-binding protein